MIQKNISEYFKHFLALLVQLFAFVAVNAQDGSFDPEQLLKKESAPKTLVLDLTNTLTSSQQQALEAKLQRLDDSTSTQVAVVLIPSTKGRGISEYNQELGRAWGVGNKKYNNGVILLVAKDDRRLDIAVGYGLEGALSDYTAQHIIDDIIRPNFKGDDYYQGIDEGTDAIMKAVKGEYHAPRKAKGPSPFRIIFIIIVIIIFISIVSGGGGGGGTFMSRRGSRGITGPIFWPTGGGGWSGGGGGWSGGGGGGFGGFGGGSFGGGGASGSW